MSLGLFAVACLGIIAAGVLLIALVWIADSRWWRRRGGAR